MGIFCKKLWYKEWALTEYKQNGVVYSRIVSSGSRWSVSGITGKEFSNIASLTYWISVHNHPRGGNGLSSAVNSRDSDDMDTYSDILEKYSDAKMNAYDHSHMYDARGFIKINRK